MLEKRIGQKDHQSSPFKPALLIPVVTIEKNPRKFKPFSSEFFYGPSFFHEEIKKQKTRKNLHVIKKKTKIYICPALSSQVLKNPEPRFTRK